MTAVKKSKKLIKRFLRHPFAVPVVSIILILIFCFGMVMIFGPAVMAEARYQVKSVGRALGVEDGQWQRLFIPNLSIIKQPETEVSAYGIEIPKIFVREKVVPNVDPTDKSAYTPALKEGIAHAAGTGIPGDGQLGYYFAHSSDVSLRAQRLNAVFYLLGKLENNDTVYLWRDKTRYEYKVVDKLVIDPEDLSFLQPQSDTERIALQTCWPVGTSLKRLIVLAERVE